MSKERKARRLSTIPRASDKLAGLRPFHINRPMAQRRRHALKGGEVPRSVERRLNAWLLSLRAPTHKPDCKGRSIAGNCACGVKKKT